MLYLGQTSVEEVEEKDYGGHVVGRTERTAVATEPRIEMGVLPGEHLGADSLALTLTTHTSPASKACT